MRTLPGVGVSSQRFFLAGVAPSARPGVASQRLPAGVGVASQRPGVASAGRPGVASHWLTDGVASTASQSDTLAFLLRSITACCQPWQLMTGVHALLAIPTP